MASKPSASARWANSIAFAAGGMIRPGAPSVTRMMERTLPTNQPFGYALAMSVTVITGGAGGIGRACAERLGERGPVLSADVAGADVECDVTDPASVAALAERAAAMGPLGALIHTAGLAPPGP